MKKVIFEKIRVRNFLSYGKDPTELIFQDGINFVTGFNKDDNSFNGVGKTSLIVESLSFVLFGDTYRNINQKEIKNDNAKDTCIVEVWYSVNGVSYEVMRSLSPNALTRHIVNPDGTRETKTKTIPETTKEIISDLGITKEVFTNTIVMTSKESSSFLSQDKSLKTKFIEGILGLEVFSKLAKEAKEEYTRKCTELGKEEARIQELGKSIEKDESYAEAHEKRKEQVIIEYDRLLDELKEIHPIDLSSELFQIERDLELKKTSLNNIKEKQQRATIRRTEVATDLRNEIAKLKKLSDKPTHCPTCKREFIQDDSHSFEAEKKQIQQEISSLEIKVKQLTNVYDILYQRYSLTENEQKALLDKQKKTLEKQDIHNKSQEKILSVMRERAKINSSVNPFSEKIKTDKKYLEERNLLLQELKDDVLVLEGTKITLSPTGVKAFITGKILDTINERLNFYLKRLNTPCRITFDEFFEETVINPQGKNISYDRLSDGEKGRVCFSMLFTFRDIRRLQSNVTVNISVFDELFDSSIDSKAAEEIMDLLRIMSEQNKEAYYIITHNPNNVMIGDGNVIRLVKENGITKILE